MVSYIENLKKYKYIPGKEKMWEMFGICLLNQFSTIWIEMGRIDCTISSLANPKWLPQFFPGIYFLKCFWIWNHWDPCPHIFVTYNNLASAGVFKVEKFMDEIFMVDKSGVEKAKIEGWGSKVRGWNVQQPSKWHNVIFSWQTWSFTVAAKWADWPGRPPSLANPAYVKAISL